MLKIFSIVRVYFAKKEIAVFLGTKGGNVCFYYLERWLSG